MLKRVVSLFVIFCFMFLFTFDYKVVAAELHANGIAITIKASPNSTYKSSLEISDDRQLFRALTKSKSISMNFEPELPYAYVTVMNKERKTDYVVDSSLRVFSKEGKKLLQLPPKAQNMLLRYITLVEEKHFGEIIPWNQVQSLFPRKSRAQVLDIESGLHFTVERRAGNRHADVQPVTKEDTYTMKKIYNGKWSWKRRAIIVQIGDHKIAASMNGMPHGAGAIQGNHFPGHFCIHFEGSTTHRSKKQDFGHHLMIVKAAGQLNKEIIRATPIQLVNIAIMAVDQHDFEMVERTLDTSNDKAEKRFLEKAKDIQEIRLVKVEEEKDASLDNKEEVEITAELSIYTSSSQKEIRKHVVVLVKHDSFMKRWKVDASSLETLLPN